MIKALRELSNYIIEELSSITNEEEFKKTFFSTPLYKKVLINAISKCLKDNLFLGLDSPDVMLKSIIPNFMATYLHLEIFNRINNEVYARFKKRLEGDEEDDEGEDKPPGFNSAY